MKISKALQETWECKEAVYEDTKSLDTKGVIDYFNKNAEEFIEEMGYEKVDIGDGVFKLTNKETIKV